MYEADAVILATGHSARDIFNYSMIKDTHRVKNLFALGIRVEHPQSLIDNSTIPSCSSITKEILRHIIYRRILVSCNKWKKKECFFLYVSRWYHCPCCYQPRRIGCKRLVAFQRNNPYANSGVVVTIEPKDAMEYF